MLLVSLEVRMQMRVSNPIRLKLSLFATSYAQGIESQMSIAMLHILDFCKEETKMLILKRICFRPRSIWKTRAIESCEWWEDCWNLLKLIAPVLVNN